MAAQITSNERHLHLSAADGAPGFHELVEDIASEFVKTDEKPSPIMMDENNPDWDSLYPFSGVCHRQSGMYTILLNNHTHTQFLTPYKLSLPVEPGHVSPWTDKFTVLAENDIQDVASGTRSLTLKVFHPGLIWTGD